MAGGAGSRHIPARQQFTRGGQDLSTLGGARERNTAAGTRAARHMPLTGAPPGRWPGPPRDMGVKLDFGNGSDIIQGHDRVDRDSANATAPDREKLLMQWHARGRLR
jgi:hypothetical protein